MKKIRFFSIFAAERLETVSFFPFAVFWRCRRQMTFHLLNTHTVPFLRPYFAAAAAAAARGSQFSDSRSFFFPFWH